MAQMNLNEFLSAYCETQEATTNGLHARLRTVCENLNPTGFLLLECKVLDSSYMGMRSLLAYGPGCTYKEIPTGPVSPRGLASDLSEVIGTVDATDVMATFPIDCDQCEPTMINGVFCHETGCPNKGCRWDAESGYWVKQRVCSECGNTVDADDACCSSEDDGPDERADFFN